MILNCCNKELKVFDVWFLKDIKDFTARKLFYGKCPKCHYPVIALYEKRISDGRVFINENIRGKHAVNTLCREQKRIISKVPNIKIDGLYGWIYGQNIQIKNKNGQVVKIRQYAADFGGGRQKVKELCNL